MKADIAMIDTPKCLNTSKVARLKKGLEADAFVDIAKIYKALSHPSRLQVLRREEHWHELRRLKIIVAVDRQHPRARRNALRHLLRAQLIPCAIHDLLWPT